MSQGIVTLADYNALTGKPKAHEIVVNTILDCMPLFHQAHMEPANAGINNITDLITDYPEGQLVGFNEGVNPEKATGRSVTDTCMMVSTYSKIDARMLKINKNSATWRAKQEKAFIRGLAHGMAKRFFYGSMAQDPRAINGLAARYWTTDASKDQIAEQVIDAGGTGATNTSIYLINWAADQTFLFHPEAVRGGLEQNDRGEQDVYDEKGRRYRAVITDYDWTLGLAVSNPRSVVRIANIDVTDLTKDASAGANLLSLMTDALELVEEAPGNLSFYANQSITTILRHQVINKTTNQLTFDTVAGKKCTMFGDVPIMKMPKSVLLNTEAQVA